MKNLPGECHFRLILHVITRKKILKLLGFSSRKQHQVYLLTAFHLYFPPQCNTEIFYCFYEFDLLVL